MKNTIKSFLLIALLAVGYSTPNISSAQYSYGNLSGNCSTNISNPAVGANVNWSAYATGGNGVYAYSWTDFQGYNATEQYLSRFYTTPGLKNMTLTISSGGQTITRYCSIYVLGTTINNQVYNNYIPPVYTSTYNAPIYNAPTYQIPNTGVQNQVLGTNTSAPKVASVYLSDVPYTGFEDVLIPLLFILTVMSWSMFLAYKFTKQSIQA